MSGLASVLLGALLLTGCTDVGSKDGKPGEPAAASALPPPTLEAKWSIAGLNANPATTGGNHWATYQSTLSGIGRGTSLNRGPLLLVDARSGKARQRTPDENRWPCLLPSHISDSGVVPVMWSHRAAQGFALVDSEPCTRITVHDATTGKILWRANNLDLAGVGGWRMMGANDSVVAVVDRRGTRACFGARDGEKVRDDHPECLSLRDRLSHADLPELLDSHGTPAPITPAWREEIEPDVAEVGRSDQILLVLAREFLDDGPHWMIRAHDRKTGRTLWQDDRLTPDRHDGAWSRHETYFVAPSGVVRVSYEHPDDPDDASETPMVLTAVDPLTGKDIKPIARIEGAWFNHQFGDMLVALTEQQLGLNSTISGFELPTW